MNNKIARLHVFGLAVTLGVCFFTASSAADTVDCDKSSCVDLAEQYFNTNDVDMAAKAYTKGCELDDGASCYNIARFYADGETAESDYLKAVPLYVKGCDLNNSASCYNLAMVYAYGYIDEPDFSKAVPFFQKGCELKDADACTDLADEYDELENYANALVYYDAACKLDDGYGCHRQAWILDNNTTPRDLAQATALYAKGCELEDGWSCNNLGYDYMEYDDEPNPYAPKDYAKGVELMVLACDTHGIGSACTTLSSAYEKGHGVKKNPSESLRYSIKACEGVDETYGGGCFDAGNFYDDGDGVKKDAKKANYYYEKGCELENSSACWFAARNYENGDGVEKSQEKAQYFFQQACDLGDEDGCEEVDD